MVDIIVIGGGLAGLTSSILLARLGFSVLLLEKNTYPFHRVCGEYISNEVIPFLEHHHLYPRHIGPTAIRTFVLSDLKGNEVSMPLDLGGFGISRYVYDHFLFQEAQKSGVDCRQGTRVESIAFKENIFSVETLSETFHARVVIGAHGKRSRLDKQLERRFMNKRSPYIGVKYHVTHPGFSPDTIALHNFSSGYCGINAIENEQFNICYLSHRSNLRANGGIPAMEEQILFANPAIRQFFRESSFLWEQPLVINEISFETKEPVIGHVLTCGDAAGMITPLCGNGMAMAIHGAKIVCDCISRHMNGTSLDRPALEREYAYRWRKAFAFRLATGRNVQRLFGNRYMSELLVSIGLHVPPLARLIMKNTHGKAFPA